MEGGSSREDVSKCFDAMKEAFAPMLDRQKEQHALLLAMKQEVLSQDEKLSALQKQLQDLKAVVEKKKKRAARRAPTHLPKASDSRLAPIPEEAADVAETKQVYTNAGVTFSRQLLLSCLDAPHGSMDIRMLPCLEELARELGRPPVRKESATAAQKSASQKHQPWHVHQQGGYGNSVWNSKSSWHGWGDWQGWNGSKGPGKDKTSW